jgi:hypothetical protein
MIAAADTSERPLVAGCLARTYVRLKGLRPRGCRLLPGCALLWSSHGLAAEPQAEDERVDRADADAETWGRIGAHSGGDRGGLDCGFAERDGAEAGQVKPEGGRASIGKSADRQLTAAARLAEQASVPAA